MDTDRYCSVAVGGGKPLMTAQMPVTQSAGESGRAREPHPTIRSTGADHTSGNPADGTGNLPLELTSFVGRRTQVGTVENLLANSRLVTLTGIGGVGKSRLALRVADRVRRDFSDGVWLVELGDTRDPALLGDVIANALGLRSRRAGSIVDVLTGYLSARNLLMILDNCEQVIDAVTALTETLLKVCPRVRILATSREALNIGGESAFPVPPLTIPCPSIDPAPGANRADAVALFADRAAAVVPASTSPTTTGPPWSASALASTGFRWRSNSPRPGCARCRPGRFCPGSTTATAC